MSLNLSHLCVVQQLLCVLYSGAGWVHSFLWMFLMRDLIGSAVSDVIGMGVCVGEGFSGHSWCIDHFCLPVLSTPRTIALPYPPFHMALWTWMSNWHSLGKIPIESRLWDPSSIDMPHWCTFDALHGSYILHPWEGGLCYPCEVCACKVCLIAHFVRQSSFLLLQCWTRPGHPYMLPLAFGKPLPTLAPVGAVLGAQAARAATVTCATHLIMQYCTI